MNTQSNKALSILMLLAGSLLVGFSMGRWLAPLAAWIGPVLIMRYARDHRVGRGYLLVLLACIIAFSVGFLPMWIGAGWPLPMVAALPVLYGLLWSLPYLADRIVSPRLKGFSSVFVFPLAATTIEFVNIYTNPVGMWGATGFTQYGDLALMQLSSLTGMIGITFLMGWFASVTNWAWENRGRGREVLRGVGAFGMVLATVYIFGFLRLNLAPMSDTEETVRVAGITSLSQSIVKKQVSEAPDLATEGSVLQAYWQTYLDETVREAQAGAKVIIWDEAVGISGSKFGVDEGILIDHAQEIARQNEIYLLLTLGVFYLDPEQPGENKLLMIDPTGTIMFEHVKYGGNMVEGTLLGDGRLHTLDTSFGVLSGVVCWDMDYPAIIQQAGRNGTGLMLVPSRDWFEIDPLHGQMAVFRAIENGMSMVRQTDQGLSIAVDAYGHVLAQTDFFGATDRTMVAQVPVKDVTTVYALGGRWLEWLAPIGFLFIVSRALIGRRREQSAPLDE